MSGSGRGGDSRGNRRRSSKRRERGNSQFSGPDSSRAVVKNAVELSQLFAGKIEKKRNTLVERPRWTPPKAPAGPLPAANCVWCGKPIKDITFAISEPDTGSPIHFDCVLAKVGAGEALGPGDTISYIGGGRFGIIHYNNPPNTRDFKIKKIFEWENKENRSEWRQTLCDHFSVT